MFLRVTNTPDNKPLNNVQAGVANEEVFVPNDNWSDRLIKLIPAEALGLYGTGSSIVPDDEKFKYALWILALVCLGFTVIFRLQATKGKNGTPQYTSVFVASVSFILWVLALAPPVGPIDLGEHGFMAALIALFWATAVPIFYKGHPK